MPTSVFLPTSTSRTKLTERTNRSPAEGFPDSGTDVGKTIPVAQCRHAGPTDDAFELLLALSLLLWIGDHGQQEPDQDCISLLIISIAYRVRRIATHCVGASGTM